MFRSVCFVLIIISQCYSQNLSQADSNDQFVCGRSKFINKCGCRQETDKIFHIPLFYIDCSRLDFLVGPSQNVLPLLMASLDLSHNLIEKLNESTELQSRTLHSLDYSYNKIKTISNGQFKNLTNLLNLNLEYNYLKFVDDNLFFALNHLKAVNLAGNGLTRIPNNVFENLQKLDELNLSNNDLGDFLLKINEQLFPKSISTLIIDDVNLRNISNTTFYGLNQLKYFSMIDNPIQEMLFLPFEKLEYLDISGTNITTLKQKHLNFTSLKQLKLKRLRRLTTIEDFAFYNSSATLETLEIEYCGQLKEFDSLVFGFLTINTVKKIALKKLSLAKNNLESLEGNFEYLFRRLKELHLQENPWHCGCPITWFRNLKSIININDTRCNSPPQLKYKIVTELKPKQFVCLENRNLHPSSVPVHNWLFPLIGVLSVIVLILVGVLLYMGPFVNYSMSWSRSIGPDSPYNRMTIETNNEESSRHL